MIVVRVDLGAVQGTRRDLQTVGMLLDFRIRHETKNQRSLDTVMRELYRRYYKELGRGWTDEEFREACERVAGVPLDENFAYATTTLQIDYARYLGYAGLEIDWSNFRITPAAQPSVLQSAILASWTAPAAR